MKRKTLLLMMLLALFSASAWAQSEYHSYSNINHTYGSGSSLYTGNSDRDPARLLDNSLSTKYCTVFTGDTWPGWLSVNFESNDFIIPSKYVIYTGDDTQSNSGRNPKSWEIRASVDGTNWTTIHTVTNGNLPATNKTKVEFEISGVTTAYKYFRFYINSIVSGSIFQLQDFYFIATVQEGGEQPSVDYVEIGNGTSTIGYAPVYGYYKSSYAQMIYTAEQLQAVGITEAGTITKIGFNSSASNSLSRKPIIYIGHTDKTSFSSNTDFVSINDLEEVYNYSNHSQWSITSGWNEFELDTPFEYDGTSNLVIAMHCGLISNYSSSSFYYTSTSNNQVIYARSDNTDPIPSNYEGNWSNYGTSYLGTSQYLPNLRLYYHENIEEISIGNDASTNSGYSLPVNMFYKNSMTQQIFTADEIGTAGTIKSISFNCKAVGSSTTTKTVKVYMKHTDKETFSSNTDVVRMDAGDVVIASFTLLPKATGWVKMTLDTPFEYDGQSNLLICCYDHSNQYPGSAYTFQTTATTGYTSITYYSDSDYNYDPTGTPTTSGNEAYYQYRNNLKMEIVPAAVSHPLTIATVEDWNAFCAAVNGGYSYANETVTMTANVGTVSTMCGTSSSKPFSGTFDGGGYTLTVGITGNSTQGQAPFQYISGATIQNLVVTGSVTATSGGNPHASGLVGFAWSGTNTIENCLVHTNVTNSGGTNVESHIGGIVGHAKTSTVVLTGCVYDGLLTSSNWKGGLIGWADKATVQLTNCLFNGTVSTTSNFHPIGCKDGSSTVSGTVTNCYYYATNSINSQTADDNGNSIVKSTTGKGKRAYSVTAQSPVSMNKAGSAIIYEVSQLTGYTTGIVYDANSTIYGGEGEILTLNLYNSPSNLYIADNGTLEGSNNPYTLTMVASNTVISGVSCAAPTDLQCTYYNRTSATLSWTRGGDETQWHVQYGPQGSSNPQILSTEDNPYVLSLTEGYTYEIKVRAVCDNENDVWSDWSNTITVTPGTMKFTFTNNSYSGDSKWDTPTNWSPVGLPTIDDDVEIRANAIIRSGYTALANNISFYYTNPGGDPDGSITIEDGGQLQHNNEGVVVTVKRRIEAYLQENEETNLGYKIISFPVSDIDQECECIEGLLTANPYDFYTFDYNNQEENVYLEWRHVSNDDGLDPYKGYLYASQNGTTISVTGVVAPSVNQDYHLDYGAGVAPFNGWQLVGNPFVCNAYLTAENGNLDFYEIQDKEEGYAEFFPIDPAVEIPPMGGVMVWLRENNNLVYSRTAPSKGPGILNMDVNKASMRGTTMLDRARVRFGEGRNLKKLQLNPRHTKLYIPEDGNDFSVYYAEGAGTIPVNFKAQDNGSYTLSFSTEDVGFNYLHLIDNMNGNDVDLLQTPYYTFDAKSTDFASRFTLVFATGSSTGSETGTFAFFNNGVWIINNPSTGSGAEATLQVVDVLGHILSSETISGSCSKAINVAPGVYMLRLINGNDVKVQKIVVRR